MGEPARLEDLTPGATVAGLVPGEEVTVVQVAWHGGNAMTITFRHADGRTGEQLLFREDETHLQIIAAGPGWSFDAPGDLFRLVSEARRIRLAYLFDPMLAVHLSRLEPLPHQISAVYGEMLPRTPLRFLLADDPGAGKTIMAGLYIKELVLRGDLARCLIVAPGGLVAQWQDELAEKFDLRFEILTRDLIEAARTGNPFGEKQLLIARLDHLARRDDLQAKLQTSDWDLVVVDEAHRMAAHWFGGEVKETKRYQLGRLLGSVTRNLLLMTATPHAGKEEDFQLFLALLDPDRFEGRPRDGAHTVDISDLMRRMIKEKLLRFDGKALFPERIAYTVPYPLSPLEAKLYTAVTDYVVEEMNRVDRLQAEGEGRRGNRVGFALTVLQRRLASSPEAIYQSLVRRRKRLEARLEEERLRKRAAVVRAMPTDPLLDDLDRDDDPEAWDDLADAEIEDLEEELVDEASAARTIAELEAELEVLARLEALAAKVRKAGTDRKWSEFATLLQDRPEMRNTDGSRRKLIVFTEHRDTLNYLVGKLRTLLGRDSAVVSIHGGTGREERRAIQEVFTQDRECLVLVATDAAGEGINLQRAHLVVNYDLPWNPNRIEQRFGRVHRIGQTEVCHMWNLVAEETREGQVYQRLLAKLEQQRQTLGGQVFDVLGEAFRGRPLRDLLLEAIRYGDQPEVRARLDQVIDERVGEGLAELVAKEALTADLMSVADVERIRLEMEEANARRLQPHFVRSFFLDAFTRLGGQAREREPGRFELTRVPTEIRARDRIIGVGYPVLPRYERVCFDKSEVTVKGKPLAELIAPGHPLLEATIDLLLERHGDILKQGAILVDDTDPGETPRVLLYLEHAIRDARTDGHNNPQVVSRRFEFSEIFPDRTARVAGAAPYLDARPATAEERQLLAPLLGQDWLRGDLEEVGRSAAIAEAVPRHLAQVRAHTMARVQKTRAAVKERLTREINYWDHRAAELREQAEAGKQPKMNPDRAQARADALAERLKRRMAELDKQEKLSALPPVVVGGALVVPSGLLERLRGERTESAIEHARAVEAVERAAVEAVLAAERALGREPEEMPRNNPGYDIRSQTPDGHWVFIEVKGRLVGAESVMVTRTEILFGLNAGDAHRLALVEVNPDGQTEVRYLRHAFAGMEGRIHFAETAVTFDWHKLWDEAGPTC
ncbi:MAG: helicase-related protein [Acidimicrobiales bacterium]